MMYRSSNLDSERYGETPAWQVKPTSESVHSEVKGLGTLEFVGVTGNENGPSRSQNVPGLSTSQSAKQIGINASDKYGRLFGENSRCQSPEGSSSAESMDNNKQNYTPPESPLQAESPGAVTTQDLGRLSLDNPRSPTAPENVDSGPVNADAANSAKRAASTELPREPSRRSPPWPRPRPSQSPAQNSRGRNRPRRGRGRNVARIRDTSPKSTKPGAEPDQPDSAHATIRDPTGPVPRDSGYGSLPNSRQNTGQVQPGDPRSDPIAGEKLPTVEEQASPPTGREDQDFFPPPSAQSKYPAIVLQPESTPISTDQLAAEVKGIYSGLVMVEAKCINIDNAQAADPDSQLGPEQWQALIALHRTLLYEHHDFLMATQHPSATPALRGLANKYSMPARMWRHGIHAFLEVLRHRRPASQEYMLAFIYLAYQMMALLFETVPSFVDTWIECLGDLARYRMAIEEEREAHTLWGSVAGRWYRHAADRHPSTGRLNHHLGILERPSLRKLSLYSKSLTCVIPFVNARDSLATLCNPLAQDEHTKQQGIQTAEARIVTTYALFFLAYDNDTTGKISNEALVRLSSQQSTRIRDFGVELVVTGVSFLMELGASSNNLWQLFTSAINHSVQTSRPSNGAADPSQISVPSDTSPVTTTTFAAPMVQDFSYKTFNLILRHRNDHSALRHVLPAVHTILVWLHAVFTVGARQNNHSQSYMFSSLFTNVFDWGELSEFLNTLLQTEVISARTLQFARQGMFLTPERPEDAQPLTEDLLIRGLIWTQPLYPSDWFNDPIEDEGRTIEKEWMYKARVERVQWLALYLAFRVPFLKFNPNTRSFHAPGAKTPAPAKCTETDFGLEPIDLRTLKPNQPSPPSQSSATVSTNSDSDGFAIVTSSRRRPVKPRSRGGSTSVKPRRDYSAVQIADEDSMQWE